MRRSQRRLARYIVGFCRKTDRIAPDRPSALLLFLFWQSARFGSIQGFANLQSELPGPKKQLLSVDCLMYVITNCGTFRAANNIRRSGVIGKRRKWSTI